MNIKKEKLWETLWYLAVFAFFCIWFAKIHPLVIYDADDWTYVAYVRSAAPMWGGWNPAKVFPEVLFPFFSGIILHTLVPLTGDYITGMAAGHALVVSGFITVYAWSLVALLRRSFALSRLASILAGTLFLVFHFLIFRTEDIGNSYMFHCRDINCYYNYLLPALLNAILLMHMVKNPRFDAFVKEAEPAKIGIFYILVYFAIFSNLVTSGMLAAFAGSCLLLSLLKNIKKFKLTDYIRQNNVWLVILAMWFVSAIFELSGGRATASSTMSLQLIHEVAYFLKLILFGANPLFWISVFTIVILALLQFLLTRNKDEAETALMQILVPLSVAGAALLIYMLAICAMVWTGSIYRSEYQFPLLCYGLVAVFVALGYLLKKQPKLMYVLPLLIIFLASDTNTMGKTFSDSLMSNYGAEVCADVSRDIVRQYTEADEAGLDQVTIAVPQHVADPETTDNWPHSLVLLHRIGDALYEQGVISRQIPTTFVIDSALNQKYNIPIPVPVED